MRQSDAPVVLEVTLTTREAAIVAKAAAERGCTPDEWATAAVVSDAEMHDSIKLQQSKGVVERVMNRG